jgi:methyl-accepting chemotaxis protein
MPLNLPRFADLRIGKKLLLVAAIPVAVMIALSAIDVRDASRTAGNANEITEIAQRVSAFGQVVHELQKERGASALFIGSKGQSFASELRSQRSDTDKALKALDQSFTALGKVERARSMLERRPAIETALNTVLGLRSRVDTLSVPVAEAARGYTAAIGALIGMMSVVPALSNDPDIADQARMLIVLTEGKERAGQERAMGSNGFAAGRFEGAIFRDFVSLMSAQSLFFAEFRALASPELRAEYDAIAASTVTREVEAMRQAAYTAPFGGDISKIAAPTWFARTTERIDLFKRLEDMASASLVAKADTVAAQARTALVWSALLAALALMVSLAAVWMATRGIAGPIVALGGSMSALADGQRTVAITGTARKDEIGAMARTLQIFQENAARIRALEEQEREASAARLARAEAMASVVSDVGEVVAAAAAGDFSARLAIEQGDEQMQRLASGINEINAVVDSATTEFVEVLQALAAGDLTRQVPTAYRGRFAELKDAINETVSRLSATLRTIQSTASDVGLSAREISTGADDLSKRTEEQASSLEESAATTEELAASVKASAQASQQGVALSGEAMQVAQSGGDVVNNAISAMARIEDASKKISDIIRVIDDIAFQTNLLALNAAVEAARAGDAGKGFAVVASEVRTLAQRSSEAAKDISGLISSSNSEVEQGVKLVRQAGDALTRIVDASRKVQATVSEVAAASGEQANGIEEMSQTVAHMDEMTQANAALAEQSAASANALAGKIAELNTLVAAFRTRDHAPARTLTDAAAPIGIARESEPERLRRLAAASFERQRAERRVPARKVANARASEAGWDEF